MSVIRARDLREKTSQELQDQLMLEKKRMFDGMVKNASGEAIKAHEKRDGRRLIARIRSILRERELRTVLDKRIAALAPKAESAAPRYGKLVKRVEERTAEIKAAIEKAPAADRSRKVKPMPKRVRLKHMACKCAGLPGVAERAAVNLAEAKRLRAALDRADAGQA